MSVVKNKNEEQYKKLITKTKVFLDFTVGLSAMHIADEFDLDWSLLLKNLMSARQLVNKNNFLNYYNFIQEEFANITEQPKETI